MFCQTGTAYSKTELKTFRDFGLPGSGFGVIEADVTVIRVVVEIDFDVVTADIIAERNVLVLIGVSKRMFKSKLAS